MIKKTILAGIAAISARMVFASASKGLLALLVALVAVVEAAAREITSDEAGKAAAAWVRCDSAPLGAALGVFRPSSSSIS